MSDPSGEVLETRTHTKNGMKFTYERLADDGITCQIQRADDGTVVIARHRLRGELLGEARARFGR
jgi:hypothetical protein